MTELAQELEAQIPPLLEDEDAGPTTFVLQVDAMKFLIGFTWLNVLAYLKTLTDTKNDYT